MISLKKLSCIIASLAAVAIFAGSARADVYTQTPFHYEGFGGVYNGYCTTNFNNGHFINACHATWTSGEKVSQTTKLDGPNLHGVITPSGEMTEVVVL